MKVLYINNYRDGTGYSYAGINNILALDAAGVEVVPRPLKLNSNNIKIPARIEELEKRSPKGSDFVIQHTLPHMMEYNGNFKKNIAMYCSETSNFIESGWTNYLNDMDVAWVTCQQMVDTAQESGVEIPVVKLPYPCNVKKFERSYKPLQLPDLEEGFTFYTIVDLNRRKNLGSLLLAFHSEFAPEEPVNLIIKAIKSNRTANEIKQDIWGLSAKVKNGLKLYKDIDYYKKEVIISDLVTEESIYRVHTTGDCFVLASYGEAWSIPAFDAMGFGKTPIVTDNTGFSEYIDNKVGWLVESHHELVYNMEDSLPDLYTGQEYWKAVSIQHLRKCMREAYANTKLREQKAELGIQRAYDFSYELAGAKLRKELESYL